MGKKKAGIWENEPPPPISEPYEHYIFFKNILLAFDYSKWPLISQTKQKVYNEKHALHHTKILKKKKNLSLNLRGLYE